MDNKDLAYGHEFDDDDETENIFLHSQEFKDKVRKLIEDDTWGKGRPMYVAMDGWVVEKWKDGTIVKLKKMEPLKYRKK